MLLSDICAQNEIGNTRDFYNFAIQSGHARMAELVDALVSKTNGVNPVPVRFRLRVLRALAIHLCEGFLFVAQAIFSNKKSGVRLSPHFFYLITKK